MNCKRTAWHKCMTWFNYKRNAIFLLCAENWFYNMEDFNVADALPQEELPISSSSHTNTEFPDLWEGIALLVVCWVFAMPVELIQQVLNEGSCWGKLKSCRENNLEPLCLEKRVQQHKLSNQLHSHVALLLPICWSADWIQLMVGHPEPAEDNSKSGTVDWFLLL